MGASTVKGPSPCSVVTRSAADTACTSVDSASVALASATMSSSGSAVVASGSSSTVSMTCTTPLDASTSGVTTMAVVPPTNMTLPFCRRTVRLSPLTVSTTAPSLRSDDSTRPGMTWYVRMPASVALFAGCSSVVSVPAGRLSKASLVGASTVKGPSPCSVGIRSAADAAVANVESSARAATICAMFRVRWHVPSPRRWWCSAVLSICKHASKARQDDSL